MSGYESPMLKSARQMSEAQAYGFNKSGTMAGQVGADAPEYDENHQPEAYAQQRGEEARAFAAGAVGSAAAPSSLESFVPDIVGYMSVVLFSLIAMFIVGSMTRLSIIIAGAFWVGSVAAMIFLLMRWHGPAAGVAWIPALLWSFPVYASLIGVLTLPLHYGQLSRDSLGDNLRSAFLIFLAPGGALCLALIGGSMALGYPGVIPLGLIIIIPGMAMIAGLFAYCALAAQFVRIAQKT